MEKESEKRDPERRMKVGTVLEFGEVVKVAHWRMSERKTLKEKRYKRMGRSWASDPVIFKLSKMKQVSTKNCITISKKTISGGSWKLSGQCQRIFLLKVSKIGIIFWPLVFLAIFHVSTKVTDEGWCHYTGNWFIYSKYGPCDTLGYIFEELSRAPMSNKAKRIFSLNYKHFWKDNTNL